jgi:hypothetical protein
MRRHIANHLVSLPASSLLLVSVVAALLVPGVTSGSGGAAKAGLELTLFSVVAQEQFLNHVDDRQRGYGSNSFGNFKAPTATTKESNGGPFPGDQALFQFNLYSGAGLKKLAGSADFTCSYSFKRNGFCDAVYQLSDGTLLATGTIDFEAKTFSLVISGGTGKYRARTGQLVATPAARLSQRLAIALSPAASAQPARTLSLASVPTSEQFLNHADDRQRGYGNNPFGNFLAPTATTKEQTDGPFPGDQALFEFNVYSGNALKNLAGSAVFTCNYGFKKHGFCNAIYQLSGGTLVASGPLDFNASNFSLVVTGGTGKYRSVAGEVVAMPSVRGSQRLAIALS